MGVTSDQWRATKGRERPAIFVTRHSSLNTGLMRYELWLGVRYLFAKRRERFISIIAAVSIGGVALGWPR